MRRCIAISALLAAACLLSRQASSQVNIEKFRRKPAERGYSGFVELDASQKTGNVELTTVELESRVDRRTASTHSFLILQTEYGWEGGRRYSNQGLIHARQVFREGGRFRPEVFIQSNYDKERLLTFRLLAGAGIRYVLHGGKRIGIGIGTSLMPEREEYDVPATDSQEQETTVIRWSNYLSGDVKMGDKTRWTSTVYVQPDLGDFGDVRVLVDSGLAAGLSERFSLVVTFALRYDSRPPDEIESLDTSIEPGLAFRF